MNIKAVIAVLMPLILSACASTSDTTTADANQGEKVYVTGSHLAHKSTDNTGVQSVSGQQATDLQRSFSGVGAGGSR